MRRKIDAEKIGLEDSESDLKDEKKNMDNEIVGDEEDVEPRIHLPNRQAGPSGTSTMRETRPKR